MTAAESSMKKFRKVSEWIEAGGLSTGFFTFERPIKSATDKAIGFSSKKVTQSGNVKDAVCWMPKAKVQEVENDFYENGPAKMFLVPGWLFAAKIDQGYEL